MLDTNIVSELARNPKGAVARRIAEVGPEAVCVSIITAAELRYGWMRQKGVAEATSAYRGHTWKYASAPT